MADAVFACMCITVLLQGSLMDERKKTTDLFGADKSPAVLCQLVVAAFQPLLGSFQVSSRFLFARPLSSTHAIR